jgi:hypothetical protein|tara:strand:- start:910 stop:1515 length:606 start_codon:yes stop_codon:yes gene_type:complete
MASETDIANVALRLVGGTRITSLTQGTPNANAVQDLYSIIRDELMEFPWNFATKRVQLAKSTTAPSFGYDNAFSLPADWIFTISVHDNDASSGTMDYRHEQVGSQNVIVTDVESAYLVYTYQEQDPNIMTPAFRRALASALARDLAITVANSNVLEDQLGKRAIKDLARAKSLDAMGSFPEPRPRGSWANSRNRSGSGYSN